MKKKRVDGEKDKYAEYAIRYKKNHDEKAFDAIVKAMKPYFSELSKRQRYHVKGMTADDVYQECLIGLIQRAIPNYNMARGSFISFAKLWVRRHLHIMTSQAKTGGDNTRYV